MPTTSPLKRRGAPFGNRNALKHGYYAHTYRPAETRTKADCPPPESMADEIALIRVLIRRVIEKTTGQESMAESLEILRTVSQAASALARLQRAQALVSGGPQDEIQQTLHEALAQFHSQLDQANDLAAAAADFQPEPGFSALPPAEDQSLTTPPPELTPIVFSGDNITRPQAAPHGPVTDCPRHTRKRHRPAPTCAMLVSANSNQRSSHRTVCEPSVRGDSPSGQIAATKPQPP